MQRGKGNSKAKEINPAWGGHWLRGHGRRRRIRLRLAWAAQTAGDEDFFFQPAQTGAREISITRSLPENEGKGEPNIYLKTM